MEELKIDIGNKFHKLLGGRFRSLGDASGEEFYEDYLLPAFKKAIENNTKLNIYLDSATGYGSSFLDETFGKLARTQTLSKVKEHLVFHTDKFNANLEYLESNIWNKGNSEG